MKLLVIASLFTTFGACAGSSSVVGEIPPDYDTLVGLYIGEKGVLGERADLLRRADYKVDVTTLDDFHVITGLTSTPIARVSIRHSGDQCVETWSTFMITVATGVHDYIDFFRFENGILMKMY